MVRLLLAGVYGMCVYVFLRVSGCMCVWVRV